jgi:hypothetical protein
VSIDLIEKYISPLAKVDSMNEESVLMVATWLVATPSDSQFGQLSFTHAPINYFVSVFDVSKQMATELSADEIALYDRQLRLWGMEAQNRMRKAKVLLVNVGTLGNEVAKNLVLAGIGALTVLDGETVTEADVASQFFVTEESVGKNV